MRGLWDGIRRRWAQGAAAIIGGGVIILVFVVILPRVADPRDIWAVIKDLSWPWMVAFIIVAIINVVTFAPPYMASLPGLRFRPALTVTTASTASTYVAPGGPAVGVGLAFAMLRAWGFRSGAVTLAVAVTTVWNQFVVFGVPIVALALLTWTGGTDRLLQSVAVIGLGIFVAIVVGFVLALSSGVQARRVGDFAARVSSRLLGMIRRDPVTWSGQSFVHFRADTIGLLKTRWHWITVTTLAGHFSVYLVLLATLRGLGVTGSEVSLVESFAAWALSRVLQAIPLTPGGFGVVELGLTGALVAFGGPQTEVVAAVLVYRFLTVAPPLVLGAVLGATWRRHHPRWEEASAAAAAAADSTTAVPTSTTPL